MTKNVWFLLILAAGCGTFPLKGMEWLSHIFGGDNAQKRIEALQNRLAGGEKWSSLEKESGNWPREVIRWAIIHGATPRLTLASGFDSRMTAAAMTEAFPEPLLQAIISYRNGHVGSQIWPSLFGIGYSKDLDAQALKNRFTRLIYTSISDIRKWESRLDEKDISLLRTAYLLAIGQRQPEVAHVIWTRFRHLFPDQMIEQMFYQGFTIAALTGQDEAIEGLFGMINQFNPSPQLLVRTLNQALRFAIGQRHPRVVEHILVEAHSRNLRLAFHEAFTQATRLEAESGGNQALAQIVKLLLSYYMPTITQHLASTQHPLNVRLPIEIAQMIEANVHEALRPVGIHH